MKPTIVLLIAGLVLFLSACAGEAPASASMTGPVTLARIDHLSIIEGEVEPHPDAIHDGMPKVKNISSKTITLTALPLSQFVDLAWTGSSNKILPPMVLFEDPAENHRFSVSSIGCSVVVLDSAETSRQLYACFLTYRLMFGSGYYEADVEGYENYTGHALDLSRTLMLAMENVTENPLVLSQNPDWLSMYMTIQQSAPNIQTLPVTVP